ncbi:MAG TPA: CPBP family intramembrane glutamic endopeptidase [Terriglobales bacterium]|nr:CPBP family intramembrane glutamic endopeptidase [Terriglobales bacterium]
MSLPPQIVQPPLEPPAPLPHSSAENPPWNGWDIVLLLAAAFFFLFFVSGVVYGVAAHLYGRSVTPAELSRDPRVLVPAQALSYVALLLFMAVLVRLRYRARFFQTIRWRWPAGADCLKFVAGGILLAGVIQALSYLFPMPPSLPIDKYFRDATSAWLLAGFGILVAPLVEELFYRGFLYPVLARPLGTFGAVVLTSIPFALMHASQLASAWAPLLMLFLVSVALTLTRAKTGSVAASVLVHMAYNFTLFTMLFFATDHFQHLEKAL